MRKMNKHPEQQNPKVMLLIVMNNIKTEKIIGTVTIYEFRTLCVSLTGTYQVNYKG